MPVRVSVRIENVIKGIVLTAPALLNTGFTTESLDVHLPCRVAEALELWPPPVDAILETLDTAGGEVLSYFIPNILDLNVAEVDRSSKTIRCNAIISTYEREILLSDAVIEELEIEILSPKVGLWRFRGEQKIRTSVKG
ncbi:hypothetical protein KEJ27_06300 [Candidatus Bathyarchaeota archaeon]|nr:hypothetical protein [Candidatus Bathyarchaeota archaeon]